MALPSIIYCLSIQLSDIDRGIYRTIKATVARHPSETEERLVARLLAYALFFEEDLVFTRGICTGDEPDIWAKGPGGRVSLWVEVGLPEPERLIKASRHALRVALLAFGNGLPNWERQHLAQLADIPNIAIATVEQSFIRRLTALLERSISWEITITGDALYLQAAGQSLETQVQIIFRSKCFA
jgi:uncharacterized protein YaeQ